MTIPLPLSTRPQIQFVAASAASRWGQNEGKGERERKKKSRMFTQILVYIEESRSVRINLVHSIALRQGVQPRCRFLSIAIVTFFSLKGKKFVIHLVVTRSYKRNPHRFFRKKSSQLKRKSSWSGGSNWGAAPFWGNHSTI